MTKIEQKIKDASGMLFIQTMREFIDSNHNGRKTNFARANGKSKQNVNELLLPTKSNATKFIIVDGDMYRLAIEGVK